MRLSPGLTWVNSTGCSVISMPSGRARHRECGGCKLPRLGKINTEMRAAGIFPLERGKRNDPAGLGERTQVEPVVPAQVEGAVIVGKAGVEELGLNRAERSDRALESRRIAHHADIVPHGIEQPFAQLVQAALPARERMERARHLHIQRVLVRRAPQRIGGDPARHRIACNAAEHGRVGDPIAAQPVGAMHAACVLARDEEPRPLGRGVRTADHAAHEIVCSRHHFDEPAGKIEAAVAAALHHALELLRHPLRPEVTHLYI